MELLTARVQTLWIAHMQVLAFQERVWKILAITLVLAILFLRKVPAQNTNTIATSRVAACQLPSTLLSRSLQRREIQRDFHPRVSFWLQFGRRT